MPDVYKPLDWKTLKDEAKRVGIGHRRLYRAAAARELRAIAVNDRGDWKTLPEWVDAWVLAGCPAPVKSAEAKRDEAA